MSSDSNSPDSTNQNPKQVVITDQISSLTLADESQKVEEAQEVSISIVNGSDGDVNSDQNDKTQVPDEEEEGGNDSAMVSAEEEEVEVLVEEGVREINLSSGGGGIDNLEQKIEGNGSETVSVKEEAGVEETGAREINSSSGGGIDEIEGTKVSPSTSANGSAMVSVKEEVGVVEEGVREINFSSGGGGGGDFEQEIERNGSVFVSVEETEVPEEEEEGVRETNSSSGGGVDEIEGAVLSPSSSGYAGELGTSSGTSNSGIDEIEEQDGIVSNDGVNLRDNLNDGASGAWVAGKRHSDEDDGSASWRKRKKHFFVLSNSGKPIYSRYGDEHKLAGFSATLQAIISFVENGGDSVKFVRAGKHQVIFLVKGPIYLVCISCTEEPQESLMGQLELIYGQMLLILTKSVNRCFERNSKFDMTPLLGGTDCVFSSLIHSFGWNPATFLHAYTCLPLAYPTRQAAGAILQDVAESGVLFAILMCKHKVISLVGAQKASLHPDDMLLLANFVLSSESFRTSESFSPICLPRYNPMAFLYAYVQYLDVDTYLMLLTTSSDAFYHLKDCRMRIETVLVKSNVLIEVQRSMLDGGLRVEDLPIDPSRPVSSSPHLGQGKLTPESLERLKEADYGIGGPAGLWHFVYRSIYLDQYVSSEFSSPINSSRQQKGLYRAYQRVYASMHGENGPHKTQFRRNENYVILCWITPDFELYAAFDPLADKALAIKTCNRVCQWVRDLENEIFLLGASPFSW
ncbi:vacuolar fusion protein MON1 homolog [Papaver somniferum]|uniref:vacuolar fusion protein MON1 homolog n=1 Tax=Papaver somniferum TaxID=3469 RepID=UPI000E6FAA93|nr:vacuolar fusion protein MON1 homolog [Papaver somniferum]